MKFYTYRRSESARADCANSRRSHRKSRRKQARSAESDQGTYLCGLLDRISALERCATESSVASYTGNNCVLFCTIYAFFYVKIILKIKKNKKFNKIEKLN